MKTFRSLVTLVALLACITRAADIPWHDHDIAAIIPLDYHENMDSLRNDPRYSYYAGLYPEFAAFKDFTAATEGWQTYFILPRDKDVHIALHAIDIDMQNMTSPPTSGKLLHESQGEALLIRVNLSDNFPDSVLIFSTADGRQLIYHPELSMMDGSIVLPENTDGPTLLDISHQPSPPAAPDHDAPVDIAWQYGQMLGVLYLGQADDIATLRKDPQYQRYLTYYPALADIDSFAAQTAGKNVYFIVPRDPSAEITIREAEDTIYFHKPELKNSEKGKLLYQGKGTPILLRAGPEEHDPDLTLTLVQPDGQRLVYQPNMRAEEGGLVILDRSIAHAIANLELAP